MSICARSTLRYAWRILGRPKSLSLRKPDQRSPSPKEPRQYPAAALGLVLVVGVLLGLLLAAVISSVVDGGAPKSGTPKASTSNHHRPDRWRAARDLFRQRHGERGSVARRRRRAART